MINFGSLLSFVVRDSRNIGAVRAPAQGVITHLALVSLMKPLQQHYDKLRSQNTAS